MSETADGKGLTEEAIELAHRCFDMARDGNASGLTPYLDAGLPTDLTDPQGNTLLMLAAYHGHPDLVRVLIARGADPDRVNDRGQSPLAGAVFKAVDGVVEALLDAGADADAGTPSARETARYFGRELGPGADESHKP